jgi:hypothetical protein
MWEGAMWWLRSARVQAAKTQVLDAGGDGAHLHSVLTNLKVLGQLSGDELAQQALLLYRRLPPAAIISSRRMRLEK